jgi:hypothetical protein
VFSEDKGLFGLLSVRAALSQAANTASRLAQDSGARAADNNSLRVREHSRNAEAARALNIHEKAVRRLYQSLQLVLLRLRRSGRVQQIIFELRKKRQYEKETRN